MKKIFAIALALVMVLSMASAFAACPTIDWACATSVCTDGEGKVEVIPYVKGNACNGNSWTANTCAGAIWGDDVYFAVKVTVDANPNADWWALATLNASKKGLDGLKYNGTQEFMTGANDKLEDLDEMVKEVPANKNELKAGEYYLVFASGEWKFVPAADFDPVVDGLFYANVNNAAAAKVCFYLKSAVDATALGAGEYLSVGDYYIKWVGGNIEVWNGVKNGTGYKSAVFTLNGSDKIEKVAYYVDGNTTADYTLTGFGFVDTNGASVGTCDPLDWLAKVMEYFKFDFRNTCYTEKAFKANFGWEDKVESCFSWSDKVQSVVDAECVVAIPKTGDASVLAWLF